MALLVGLMTAFPCIDFSAALLVGSKDEDEANPKDVKGLQAPTHQVRPGWCHRRLHGAEWPPESGAARDAVAHADLGLHLARMVDMPQSTSTHFENRPEGLARRHPKTEADPRGRFYVVDWHSVIGGGD